MKHATNLARRKKGKSKCLDVYDCIKEYEEEHKPASTTNDKDIKCFRFEAVKTMFNMDVSLRQMIRGKHAFEKWHGLTLGDCQGGLAWPSIRWQWPCRNIR